MTDAGATRGALTAALLRLLRPLCRLMLRNNVAFSAFAELAKRVYVETAMEDFALPGRKATVSRASVLTGLTRKEVQRLMAEREGEPTTPGDEGVNRAARVLTAWARDPAFHGPDGEPARLPLQEGAASFASLVRRYSGDMPVRAVLDEMLRVGAVRRGEDGRIELVQRAYVPVADAAEKLAILGNDVADLVNTIDHNIRLGAADPRFQRKVMYRNYPASQLPAFRALSAEKSQALLEAFDLWLSEHADAAAAPAASDAPAAPMRLGVGIYYFEEPMPRP